MVVQAVCGTAIFALHMGNMHGIVLRLPVCFHVVEPVVGSILPADLADGLRQFRCNRTRRNHPQLFLVDCDLVVMYKQDVRILAFFAQWLSALSNFR